MTIGANAFTVNSAGSITALTGISTSGAYTQSGTSINYFTGNVGIGGAAPTAPLSIGANAFTVNSSGTITAVTGITTSGAYTQSGTSINYFTGNVGIATVAPSGGLDVEGTLSPAIFYAIGQTSFIGQNVGIGTFTPKSVLDVEGTVSSTVFYAATSSIGHNVGIGSYTPGQKLDVSGTIRMTALGTTLSIPTGTNGCIGTGTLSSGTQTVSTTCTPATKAGIFITDTLLTGANIGSIGISTVTAGTSFVVESTNVSDASTYNWLILKSQ